VDRFVSVFSLNQPQFGVFLSPVVCGYSGCTICIKVVFFCISFCLYCILQVQNDATARFLAYLIAINVCFVVQAWRCNQPLGSDRWTRSLVRSAAMLHPLLTANILALRLIYYAREYKTPGNTVFFTEPYTAVATIFACQFVLTVLFPYPYGFALLHDTIILSVFADSVIPQMVIYSKMRVLDSLKRLRQQVSMLEHSAETALAVSSAQTEFTR
jgi:hypothetical protein